MFLFIDEAYYLYKPENERDYGGESIEILLQVMENHRDDLGGDSWLVIKIRWISFLKVTRVCARGLRIILDFPDYTADELRADC